MKTEKLIDKACKDFEALLRRSPSFREHFLSFLRNVDKDKVKILKEDSGLPYDLYWRMSGKLEEVIEAVEDIKVHRPRAKKSPKPRK